jgi:two-component system OmpR family response regulator
MNVLIIDDSDLALKTMASTLTLHGHKVLCASSPIGVTRIILNEAIDVVVVDVNLPSMRGDALAALFRKQPRLAHLGVVLVSGIDAEELSRLTRESEADGMCTKKDIPERLHLTVLSAYHARRSIP